MTIVIKIYVYYIHTYLGIETNMDTKLKSKKERKKGDRNTNHISLEGLTDAHNFDIKECKTTGVTTLQIFSLSKLHFFTVSQFQL